MNETEFINELKKIDIILTHNQINKFKIYYEYLIEYNKHTNLTSITTKEDVYLKHFYDSCLLTKTIDFNNIDTMLDIGCGAGFPGIVIKILFPNIKLTLLDSNNKKTKFCESLSTLLELDNVEIVNKRAEEYIIEKREYFDIVSARAVKNLPVLIELSIPYVKQNGYFIAMKSDYEEELNNSKNGIKVLGAEYIKTININLPNNTGIRNFILIKKINKTNPKYPRNYSQIIKKPL